MTIRLSFDTSKMSAFASRSAKRLPHRVELNLYGEAGFLWDALDERGVLERLKNIEQLGYVADRALAKTTRLVPKAERPCRYDYVVLQLYLAKLVRDELSDCLLYGYNNTVKLNFAGLSKSIELSVGECLQLLVIATSIGHFRSTFTGSRAICALASEDLGFFGLVSDTVLDDRFKRVAENILLYEKYYMNVHLLNALTVLERVKPVANNSVQAASELLYLYLGEGTCEQCENTGEKLEFVFGLFRAIRDLSFLATDLRVANVPFGIDLLNREATAHLLRELLSRYNDNLPSVQLVGSFRKLLDGCLYNEDREALMQHCASRSMVRKFKARYSNSKLPTYFELWEDSESVFNQTVGLGTPRIYDNVLKITFGESEIGAARAFLGELEKMHHVVGGCYSRGRKCLTVLAAVRLDAGSRAPRAALRVLQSAVRALRRCISGNSAGGSREAAFRSHYLLAAKFFLFHYFGGRSIRIDPSATDSNHCVYCVRGHAARHDILSSLLKDGAANASKSQRHEAEALRGELVRDTRNDISIVIPASVKVFENSAYKSVVAEFDGVCLFPHRKQQVLLVEAKGGATGKRGCACLRKKLGSLGVDYDAGRFDERGRDAIWCGAVHCATA